MTLKKTKSLLMAIETLQEVKSAMIDAGVDTLCSQTNHLMNIGITVEQIAELQQEIEQELNLPQLEALLSRLQQSGVSLTKMEHYKLVFSPEDKHIAIEIEEELIAQGFIPFYSVHAPARLDNKKLAILRRQVGTDQVA